MGMIDYLLLGAILLAVLAAVCSLIKRRKQGKACDGNCIHCDRCCAAECCSKQADSCYDRRNTGVRDIPPS